MALKKCHPKSTKKAIIFDCGLFLIVLCRTSMWRSFNTSKKNDSINVKVSNCLGQNKNRKTHTHTDVNLREIFTQNKLI